MPGLVAPGRALAHVRGMKNRLTAPLALLFVALALSGCFFPGGYHHDRGYGGGDGGYARPEGPPPGAYGGGGGGDYHPVGGYHQGP